MIGKTLSHYRITAALGAGGMGEVYRATDTRLDREVAIKILPAGFASNAEALARFQREAKSISSLNHAHVCTLHDVGQEGDLHYLVMELIEGESLAERLKKGPLPTHEVLRYGSQVAEALDAAHRHGIIHRDLKPGNVMLTRAGAKLLDFGLARTASEGGSPIDAPSTVETEHRPLTTRGTILGTFQYMSPEQLEGLEADARTDIFALGALLHEMATGQRAFQGDSKTSLIAAIVSAHPQPVSQVVPMTPPALDHVVTKCLEKDPDDRWQSAYDVASELRWISSAGSGAGVPAPLALRRKSRERLAWGLLVGALSLALLAAGVWIWRGGSSQPARVVSATLSPPAGTSFSLLDSIEQTGSLAVSPDGRHIVFGVKRSGETSLWLRSLDSHDARPLLGTEGGTWPFWSPDSRFVAFLANGKLRKVDIAGAPPVTICDVGSSARHGTWNEEGVILFSPHSFTSIHQVSASGGTPEPVTTLSADRAESTHRYPIFLPDGRRFLYMSGSHGEAATGESTSIWAASLDSDEQELILRAQSNVAYVSGHLLLVRQNVLLAQPFDPDALEPRGDPVAIAEDILFDAAAFRSAFSVSRDGVLVYATGGSHSREERIVFFDRSGGETSTFPEVGQYAMHEHFRLSPDGHRFATDVGDPETGLTNIWIGDVDRGTRSRFTFEKGFQWWPTWSQDGSRLAWSQVDPQKPGFQILVRDVAGSSPPALVFEGEQGQISEATSWTPDGKMISVSNQSEGDRDIWLVLATADGTEPIPLLNSPEYNERRLSFSSNGKWVIYSSDETGRQEIHIASYPDLEIRSQVSRAGAEWGFWVGSDEIVFFKRGDPLRFMSARVRDSSTGLDIAEPVELFAVPGARAGAVSRAGRTFAAVLPVEPEDPSEAAAGGDVRLVLNWHLALGE